MPKNLTTLYSSLLVANRGDAKSTWNVLNTVMLIIMYVTLCMMLTLSTTIIIIYFLTANTILVKISRTSFGNYMKNGLSFIHFNPRSLSSNFKYISNFLTELNITFDLITISEPWSNTHYVDDYDLKGYDICHKVIKNNKKGGGVACYVNKELASKYFPHKSIVVDNLLECITIEIMISGHKNVIHCS